MGDLSTLRTIGIGEACAGMTRFYLFPEMTSTECCTLSRHSQEPGVDSMRYVGIEMGVIVPALDASGQEW
jgi:hypothetical protein